MLLGLFKGHTLASLQKRNDTLTVKRAELKGDIDAALADRQAAIKELGNEVIELAQLKVRIS